MNLDLVTPQSVVIPQILWRPAVSRLLLDPNLIAIGGATINEHPQANEFLVRQLDVVPRNEYSESMANLSTAVVVLAPTTIEEGRPSDFWATLPGSMHRMIVVLLIGLGAERSGWYGMIWENGQSRHVGGFRVVGSGMLRCGSPFMNSMQACEENDRRWDRTRGPIGPAVDAIKESCVAIVGVSRTGTAVAQQLTLLGVGSLMLIDRDRIERENLDAMLTVSANDIGQEKAVAVGRQLRRLRKDLNVTSIPHSVTHPAVATSLRKADLIITAVDEDTPRLLTALLANRWLKPHLDIGVGITQEADGTRLLAGDIRLLLPGEGCVRCVGGLPNQKEAELELLAPPNSLRRGKPVPWNQLRLGSLVTLNGLAASMGVQLWIDLLTGKLASSRWQRFRWLEGEGLQSDHARVGPDRNCPICCTIGRKRSLRPDLRSIIDG